MRVDDVLIHMRDYRYFHKFGEPLVHLDIVWKEINLESPTGTPTPTNAYNPFDSVINSDSPIVSVESQLLTDSIRNDRRLQRDINQLSQLLPIVNESNNIHRYYIINL